MKYHVVLFLFFLAAINLAAADIDADEVSADYTEYMMSGRYRDALNCSYAFLLHADMCGDIHGRMMACSYIGQAFIALDMFDSAHVYLSMGLDEWNMLDSSDRIRNDYMAIYSIYSSLGIYEISTALNYDKACGYFLNGMRTALSHEDYINYAVLGANLVLSYNLRKDTAGLGYAREIYALGQRIGNQYVKHIGSYVCASMYYLKGDIARAGKYIEETISQIDRFYDKAGVWCLNAKIQASTGRYDEAESSFDKAVLNISEESVTTAVYVYLSYGRFLYDRGNLEEAMDYALMGIGMSNDRGNRIYLADLYELASWVSEARGDSSTALHYYKAYHSESSDINRIEQERAINALNTRFAEEQHSRELRELRRNAGLIILLIAVCLAGTWIMYRNRNRMYTRIARQYKESVAKERALEEQISALTAGQQDAAAKYSNSSLTKDSGRELYARLEHLMKHDRIYLEKNLTRERIAERLESNRTYLSQVIHEYTGLSLVAYVNTYRINEAIAVLSDPMNDIPLKALCSDLGFNSSTTFYKLFQDKVGMTPAKYREKIIEISKKGNCRK